MSKKNDDQSNKKKTLDIEEGFAQLKQQLEKAQEREKRAFADYQNLMRRSQEEKQAVARLANQELLQALLPALENLDKAAAQTDDPGLDMVIKQIWQALEQFGLEEIKVAGQPYDLETMEVVDKQGEGDCVIGIVSKGFKLKDKVIQHAKVILGDKAETA